MAVCKHIKADGKQCQSRAMLNSDYCYFHNPDVAEERQAANIRGGRGKRPRVDTPLGVTVKFESVDDVLRLLEVVTEAMLNGVIDQRVASTTAYLSNVVLRALESSEMEKRVEKLEKILNIRKSA